MSIKSDIVLSATGAISGASASEAAAAQPGRVAAAGGVTMSRAPEQDLSEPRRRPLGAKKRKPLDWDPSELRGAKRKTLDPVPEPGRSSLGPGPATPQLAPGAGAAPAPLSSLGAGGDSNLEPSGAPRPRPPAPTSTPAPQTSAPAAVEGAGEGEAAAAGTGRQAPAESLPDALQEALELHSPAAAGSGGAAPRFSTLSPLLDLEGLAASPPGAPKGLETLHLPAGGAPSTLEQPGATTWGSALVGGHGEPRGGAGGLSGGVSEGAQLPSAGAQMSTPPQQMAGARAGEAGALAGGADGLTPGSSLWARNVLASGGAGLSNH